MGGTGKTLVFVEEFLIPTPRPFPILFTAHNSRSRFLLKRVCDKHIGARNGFGEVVRGPGRLEDGG